MDWSGKQASAKRMIDKYGKSFTVKISSLATYDSATDAFVDLESSYPVKGVVANYSMKEIDGTTIKVGDRKLLMAGSDLPDLTALGDKKLEILEGSVTITTGLIVAVGPGGVNIVYQIQIKG
jgi:hypothetical protein